MAFLDRHGVRISHELFGQANGSHPVLLSHGFGASAQMWEPNIGELSAARPIITWDLRGHGRSGSPDDPASYTQAACLTDMAAVLDAHGAQPAVLGGLSLGGYLSLAFCLAYPDRVAALMLFDTGPGFRNDEARQRWNDRAMATADRLDRDGVAALGNTRLDTTGWSAHGLALAAKGMLTQRDASVIESLPSIELPVLVLVGALDKPFLGAADYVSAKIPHAQRVEIPDAGHMSNLDQPELFNQHVVAFLGQLG